MQGGMIWERIIPFNILLMVLLAKISFNPIIILWRILSMRIVKKV
jgi:hypothetical protein